MAHIRKKSPTTAVIKKSKEISFFKSIAGLLTFGNAPRRIGVVALFVNTPVGKYKLPDSVLQRLEALLSCRFRRIGQLTNGGPSLLIVRNNEFVDSG